MTMETLARHGLAFLLDASLRSLPLLAIAGIALFCLRRSSAAARHLVLLLTLAALLLLPLLSSALPGWRVVLLPHHTPVFPPAAVMSTPDSLLMPPQTTGGQAPMPSANPSVLSSPDPQPATRVSRMTSMPWTLYGFALWLIGVLAVLTPVVAGLVCVWRLERRSLPITGEAVTGLAAELGRQSGVRQTVVLRQGRGDDTLTMPMTWGWRRPIVLLPSGAVDWPTERLRVVLLHELAHVRRGDWLWQMLAHLTCALYWFHPGVWLMARGLRVESERACDDGVLSAGVSAQSYSRHLLDVAHLLSTGNRGPLLALPMADISQLESRMRHVLDSGRSRQMISRRKRLIAMILVTGLLLPLASLRPVSGSQQSPALPVPVVVQKPFTVVVDAGHGGQDTGAIGLDGTQEKNISLAVALKLKETLTKEGVKVIMTRTDDTFLPVMARPVFVKANHAQYFVSIHCDSRGTSDSRSGLEVYYHGGDRISQWMASNVLKRSIRAAGLPIRDILSDRTRFTIGGFGVLRGSPVPAVLVDCGFLNNAHDLKALHQEQTQQKIADSIAAGLVEFNSLYSGGPQKSRYVTLTHQQKSAQLTEVYAVTHSIIQNTSLFYQANTSYQNAIKQHDIEALSSLLASRYVFNGHAMDIKQAKIQLQKQIDEYGTIRYGTKTVKSDLNLGIGRGIILSTEHWGSDKIGAKALTLSRRDVWAKTPAGWRLTSTDEQ